MRVLILRVNGAQETHDVAIALRDHLRGRRDAILPIRQAEILALRDHGYTVEQKTPYHFRINGTLDLFPVHLRFHFIPTNTRGRYRTAITIAEGKL